jgi:hypothetical protein
MSVIASVGGTSVCLEPSDEVINSFEYVSECLWVGSKFLSRLRDLSIKMARRKMNRDTYLKEDADAGKASFPGESTWEMIVGLKVPGNESR